MSGISERGSGGPGQASLFGKPAPPRPPVAPAGAARPPEPAPARSTPLTVGELTERIARQIAMSFGYVAVMGEVSQPTDKKGNLYFRLLDDRARLDAVIWADRRAYVRFTPKEGMRVVATGAIRVWEKTGTYSLRVDRIEPVGEGELQRVFEALKSKLRAEGLFDESRKRPLPVWISAIGLVTSETGAARHDIETTLASGDARVRVVLHPARVQGEGAGAEIARAVRVLSARGDLDAIVVARGGGSAEELWAFNEEEVARALAASPVPTISAVGHETDVTLSDFVADHRAATPTAAATLIVSRNRGARDRYAALCQRLVVAVDARRRRWRDRVAAVSAHRVLERERGRIQRMSGRLSDSLGRAGRGLRGLAATRAARLRSAAAQLEALSPLAVLSRGYALARDERGRILRDVRGVAVDDVVSVRLGSGGFAARVTDVRLPADGDADRQERSR